MVICRPSSYLFATITEFQTAPIDPFFLLFVYSRVTAHLWFVSVARFYRFPCGRAPGRLFALFRTRIYLPQSIHALPHPTFCCICCNILVCLCMSRITGRECPKSTPYLRLKNSKRTSKCQKILFYITRKTQKLDRIGATGGTLLDFSSILSQIIKKIEGETPWWKEVEKNFAMPKNLKGGL